MSELVAGTIATRPGLTLSYVERGPREAPTVVLLHGYADSWRSFAPAMASLPRYGRVVALTQRGHGDSAKPARGYTIDDFAADTIEAMDLLGIGAATLIGHSMGSLIATRIAAERPERVRALLLVGAFATLKGNDAVEAFWRDEVRPIRGFADAGMAREFRLSTLARPVSERFLRILVAETQKVPGHVWRDALRAMLDEDRSADLARIAAPTRIVWGDFDTHADRAQQEILARGIPGARLSIHPGAGHSPHWEDPELLAVELAVLHSDGAKRAA